MTLPSSGPLSISQIAAEFGVALPCVFPRDFYGKPGIPSSGPLILPDSFYGKSNRYFSPDGGSISRYGATFVSVTLIGYPSAVWTYTGGGTGSSVSIASGGNSGTITFQLSAPPLTFRSAEWSVQGVIGDLVRNFTVSLTAGTA